MAITNGYVTLATAKAYLGIPVADTVDDAMLEQIVESASRSIDRIAGRYFYQDSTTSQRFYRAVSPVSLLVDDISTTTGLTVDISTDGTNYSTNMVYNTDFIVEPFNALATGRPFTLLTSLGTQYFPYPWNYRPGVRVTARWGWPAVPDDIVEATLILCADLYKRKDSVGGVLGLSEMGAIRMSPLGRDISAMVRAYRREVVG